MAWTTRENNQTQEPKKKEKKKLDALGIRRAETIAPPQTLDSPTIPESKAILGPVAVPEPEAEVEPAALKEPGTEQEPDAIEEPKIKAEPPASKEPKIECVYCGNKRALDSPLHICPKFKAETTESMIETAESTKYAKQIVEKIEVDYAHSEYRPSFRMPLGPILAIILGAIMCFVVLHISAQVTDAVKTMQNTTSSSTLPDPTSTAISLLPLFLAIPLMLIILNHLSILCL